MTVQRNEDPSCGFHSEATLWLALASHTIHIPRKDAKAMWMLPEPQTAVPGSLEG